MVELGKELPVSGETLWTEEGDERKKVKELLCFCGLFMP